MKRDILFILAALVITIFFFFYSGLGFSSRVTSPKIREPKKLPIAAGVVPHHLLAGEIINKFFQELSNYPSLKTVVLLSPDHYKQTALTGGRFITISSPEIAPFVSQIVSQNPLVKINDFSVGHDQGVVNLMPFFKTYLPHLQVIPFLISPLATEEETKELVDQLNEAVPPNTVFIASVDFTHYLPKPLLLLHDVKSIRVLDNFEEKEFPSLDVDSWQALYAVRYFAHLRGEERVNVIAHKTSYDYVKVLPENSFLGQYGGVSYYSVIFGKGKGKKIKQKSALLVGDIMMARGVALLTDKYGLEYPYEKIKDMFRGIDIVYANLEGPVVANAPRVSMRSVNFGFSPKIVKLLKELGFTVLNIANNHMKDRGEQGIESTRNFLRDNNIVPLGDYQSCSQKYYYREGNILFIGAHLVYGNYACIKEILKNVKRIKRENPNIYIIVTPHWGTEYTPLPNKFQINTAHAFIDAGVDAIIGHHPHVVQAVEEYKGKPIFYSLGNFVFDMYFSKEVQQELAVGVEYHPDKVIFYLIPVQSHKSQLSFMKNKENSDFLNWLASISSPSLQDSIKEGIIEVNLSK